jgi:hypothetical protein
MLRKCELLHIFNVEKEMCACHPWSSRTIISQNNRKPNKRYGYAVSMKLNNKNKKS